jgi:hypothetical protein
MKKEETDDLLDLLERLAEYMDDRSGDLDGDYGERLPNTEMKFSTEIEEAIQKLEKPDDDFYFEHMEARLSHLLKRFGLKNVLATIDKLTNTKNQTP